MNPGPTHRTRTSGRRQLLRHDIAFPIGADATAVLLAIRKVYYHCRNHRSPAVGGIALMRALGEVFRDSEDVRRTQIK